MPIGGMTELPRRPGSPVMGGLDPAIGARTHGGRSPGQAGHDGETAEGGQRGRDEKTGTGRAGTGGGGRPVGGCRTEERPHDSTPGDFRCNLGSLARGAARCYRPRDRRADGTAPAPDRGPQSGSGWVLQDHKATLVERRHGMMTSLALRSDASAPLAGADLTAARARMGRSLPEMSRYLRIRQPFLEALEQGRLDDLPGSAYALGFLRAYAAALGLDSDEVVRRFKAEASAIDRKTALAFPAPLPERGPPTGALMLLAVALVVGAYAGWYRLSGEGRLPAEAVQPVPARLARPRFRARPACPHRRALRDLAPCRRRPRPPRPRRHRPAARGASPRHKVRSRRTPRRRSGRDRRERP